jgi:hypothetical protein
MHSTEEKKVFIPEECHDFLKKYIQNIFEDSDGPRSLDWNTAPKVYFAEMMFTTIPGWRSEQLLLTCDPGVVWELKEFTNRKFVIRCFSNELDYLGGMRLSIVRADDNELQIHDVFNEANIMTFALLKGFSFDQRLGHLFSNTFYLHPVDINGVPRDLTFIVSPHGNKIAQRSDLKIRWVLKDARTSKEIKLAVKCFSDADIQLGTWFADGGAVAMFEKKRPDVKIFFQPEPIY